MTEKQSPSSKDKSSKAVPANKSKSPFGAILFILVLASLGANAYMYQQVQGLKTELAERPPQQPAVKQLFSELKNTIETVRDEIPIFDDAVLDMLRQRMTNVEGFVEALRDDIPAPYKMDPEFKRKISALIEQDNTGNNNDITLAKLFLQLENDLHVSPSVRPASLVEFKQLAVNYPALLPTVDALSNLPFSETASLAELKTNFHQMARDTLSGQGNNNQPEWLKNTVGALSNMVKVRRKGNDANLTESERAFNIAEVALARQNLSSALQALAKVDISSAALQQWIKKAANLRHQQDLLSDLKSKMFEVISVS